MCARRTGAGRPGALDTAHELVPLVSSLSEAGDALSSDAVAERLGVDEGEAEKLTRRNKRLASPWSIGFFGGYDPFRDEAVCGVGVTYAVIRF